MKQYPKQQGEYGYLAGADYAIPEVNEMSATHDFERTVHMTEARENAFYNAAELADFKDNSKIIFDFLKNAKLVSFGEHLKRYIYFKAEMQGDYKSIEDDVYVKYIQESFKRTGTPNSFEPCTSKLSALAKNWLKQTSVSRKTVFLLGFGLEMTVQEVSRFLKKALLEGDFYFKNPFEIICWYCYKNGYGYSKMEELMTAFKEQVDIYERTLVFDKTVGMIGKANNVKSAQELLELLKSHGLTVDKMYSMTARDRFNILYDECKKIVAKTKQAEADWEFSNEMYDIERDIISKNKIPVKQRKGILDKIKEKRKKVTENDVTEADIEKFVCSGTPIDGQGNLTKISASSLAVNFSKKRMSRKHINDIISGNTPVERFDLITLKFFICADKYALLSNNDRWWKFVEETNEMLEECSMGELYIVNPYDCFLQMCMLTDVPLSTYDSVIEASYEE